MNQKGITSTMTIVLVVVAIIVVGGGAIYFATSGSGNNKSNNSNATQPSSNNQAAASQQPASSQTADYNTLLADATAGKYDVKCTFEQKDTSGTFYVRSNDKFRLETTTSHGPGYLIKLGNKTYTWSSGSKQGIVATTSTSTSQDQTSKYTDQATDVNLKCAKADNLSDSLFKVPSDVKFIDTSQLPGQ